MARFKIQGKIYEHSSDVINIMDYLTPLFPFKKLNKKNKTQYFWDEDPQTQLKLS